MVKELDIAAVTDNLDIVLQFVDEVLKDMNCSPKIQMQIDLAVEEVFVNIANYAYQPETGNAAVRVETDPERSGIVITFTDSGKPYNPLAREDPDVTLPIGQRKIGGLGIYLVKSKMDHVSYEYRDGMNVLTIEKKVEGQT